MSPHAEADVRHEGEHPRQHADGDGEPDVDEAQSRRVERAEDDVRRELAAHVAAERLVDLPRDVGGRRVVPAARDELAAALHDAVEVDEEIEREDRNDERAEDDRRRS